MGNTRTISGSGSGISEGESGGNSGTTLVIHKAL